MDKYWFCQFPSAPYIQISEALLIKPKILSARLSEVNDVIWLKCLCFDFFIHALECDIGYNNNALTECRSAHSALPLAALTEED